MSTVNISGTLILNGNLTCDGDISIHASGVVISIPDPDYMGAYNSCSLNDYIRVSGLSRTIRSVSGNINIAGVIDGDSKGFGPNEGPGGNSRLESNLGKVKGYGASHAGTGAAVPRPGETLPLPYPAYGSYEAPVSLGSGSTMTWGGSGIKIEAPNGLITINGKITMNGGSGAAGEETGGGAGGSVWINGWRLAGTGSISAKGGDTSYEYGSGGSGGYISLWYTNSNISNLTLSVDGGCRARPGRIFFHKADPILGECFTGNILNTKWWEIIKPRVTIHNALELDSTTNSYNEPEVRSKFFVQGQRIVVDASYIRVDPVEPDFYNADFMLYIDQNNWIGVGRRPNRMFAIYSLDGYISQYAVEDGYRDYSLRIFKNDSTFHLQYYDSTSSPITIHSEVIPFFADKKFNIQFRLRRDLSLRGRILEQLRLTRYHIENKYVSLAGYPNGTDNISVSVVDGAHQFYGVDFYLDGAKVRWDDRGLAKFKAPFEYGPFLEYYTLTEKDVSGQFLTLNIDASYSNLYVADTAINVVGGPTLEEGTDYVVADGKIRWVSRPISKLFSAGDVLRVFYKLTPWYNPTPLSKLLQAGDVLRIEYEGESRLDPIVADFDDVKIWEGIVTDAETTESVIYVDSKHGSDTSDGRQLSPLQNLFVATAWAKRGSTIVLYDGTYNPASVCRKNLTIRGASGVKPVITSRYSQDTTGQNWERNALSFYSCQGVVTNLTVCDSTTGIYIENSPGFEIRNCEFRNTETAIQSIDSVTCTLWNKIHDSGRAVDISHSSESELYSNVIYDCSAAICFTDVVKGGAFFNTIDDCTTGIIFDQSSSGAVASNNLTNLNTGVVVLGDSTPVLSLGNNYYGTITPVSGIVDSTAGDFSSDPLYVNRAERDYHLMAGSPNIGRGLSDYDQRFIDFDGASRAKATPLEVGAYEYIGDGTHVGEKYYVAGRGDDFYNFGSLADPFRTLDKAFSVADSTIVIDGGHYDSTYLRLMGVPLELNPLTVFVPDQSHFVTYLPLTVRDILNGYVRLPGFILADDKDFDVALSVIDRPVAGKPLTSGPAQEYGKDFVIQFGAIRWAGYGLEPLLDVGDILRILYVGNLYRDVIDTVNIHNHYGNIDLGHAIYVSPNGSDSTVTGGDGTNTGGDGSRDRPYRTIQKALEVSAPGDHIVVMSGEYPLFTPLNNRVLVPALDKTAVVDKYPRVYIEDFFVPRDFRSYNHIEHEHYWDMTYAGDSTGSVEGGYLSLAYDGTGEVRAVSTYSFLGNFEVSATLRQAVMPIVFSVHSSDTTASVWLFNGDYTSSITTDGKTKNCWGHLDINVGEASNHFTEYVCINADHIRRGYVPLSMVVLDALNTAVNLVGGSAQEYGVDFRIEWERIIWSGMGLDGELVPGDVLRVSYKALDLTDPVRIKISLDDGIMSIKAYDFKSWRTLNKRVLKQGFDSQWKISTYMSQF